MYIVHGKPSESMVFSRDFHDSLKWFFLNWNVGVEEDEEGSEDEESEEEEEEEEESEEERDEPGMQITHL